MPKTSKLPSMLRCNLWTRKHLKTYPSSIQSKAINSKWILKIITKVDGSFDKYKARLVASCFTQVHRIDYMHVYSLVVKLISIKVLLALATQYNLERHRLGVKTSFLNGFLEEDNFLIIPKGLTPSNNPNMVCKLPRPCMDLSNPKELGING